MQFEKIKDNDKIKSFSAKLDEHIKSIVEKEGYITYDVEKREISPNGGNYMANLLAIDIKGKTEQGDKETNIFVKQSQQVEIPLIFNITNVYNRETFMYTDLFKEMYDLQEKENVPVADRFKIAKSFIDTNNDEAIILENLVAKGFKTNPRLDVVKLEYAELVVKNLARLHGLSLVMEVRRPDYFEKNIKNMNCMYICDDYFHEITHGMRKTVTQFLPDGLREKVGPQLESLVDKYPSYMIDSSCPIKTVCHGDYRPNNIMVKEIDDKPTEVIAVDYQTAFYGNPVLDLIYFIFWGTDQEFRRNHLDHVKQLYYQYLGTFLAYFDMDLEKYFPKKEFKRQFQEKLDFGLIVAVCYLPFLFPVEDDIPDFSKMKEPLNTSLIINIDDKYVERFRGVVDDFIQWGYLNN